MLPNAIMCGIKMSDFWDYTYGELIIIIQAMNDKEMLRMRQEALNTYILADLIGASVARLMDKNSKFPAIHDVYPSLFEKPQPKQQDWQLTKARLLEYANAHNKKRSEGKK